MTPALDPRWVSVERMAAYLEAADGDEGRAEALYRWNAEASAALFEVLHHFEVLLRNTVVEQLRRSGPVPSIPPGMPWTAQSRFIDEVVARLGRRGKPPTTARVVAGLSFGVWQRMFSGTYREELWRHALHHVFGHSRADRAVIADYLESVQQLRNTIAHHGALIDLDVAVELQKLLRLTGWIDPAAERWIRSIERVSDVVSRRPVRPARNVVVVSATHAWQLYDRAKQHAYVFPAGRSLKALEYIAFYADQEIKTVVPRILRRFDAIDWNRRNARRLGASSDPFEQRLGSLIPTAMALGWNESVYQVLMLSGPSDERTVRLPHVVDHSARGRGSAFVRTHRYIALTELRSAFDTADMGSGGFRSGRETS